MKLYDLPERKFTKLCPVFGVTGKCLSDVGISCCYLNGTFFNLVSWFHNTIYGKDEVIMRWEFENCAFDGRVLL